MYKLVKYKDGQLDRSYIWFYIDDQVGARVSPIFKSELDAAEWFRIFSNQYINRMGRI